MSEFAYYRAREFGQCGTTGNSIMNAYVSENHIVVGQQRLKDKENKIVAIPQLLDKMGIEDAIISIDAIGIHYFTMQAETDSTCRGAVAPACSAIK